MAGSGHPCPDEGLILSSLTDLVAGGEHQLEAMLAAIADAAMALTGASGVALAMWKDSEMVCRARSGETAPLLGAQLNSEAGISGACLRSGERQDCTDTENDPRVDVEVCRSLGVRSIAVVPIKGRRRLSGILEAFSTGADAFSEHHLKVLEKLAALAEWAQASEAADLHPAQVLVEAPRETVDGREFPPAAEHLGGVIPVSEKSSHRSRLVLGVMALAAMLLLLLANWLGWRGRSEKSADMPVSSSAVSSSPTTRAQPSGTAGDASNLRGANKHLWDGGSAAGTDPVGRAVAASGSVPATGVPKANTKAGVIAKKENQGAPLMAPPLSRADTGVHKNGSEASRREEAGLVAPPEMAGGPTAGALPGFLSPRVVLPGYNPPVSQGVTGGQLLHRVSPIYPAQAKMFHVEGKVVLSAMVMEDGSVRDAKVVQGDKVLAQSAVQAVKQWRYQPFVLNGKPVKTETSITIDFQLPTKLP